MPRKGSTGKSNPVDPFTCIARQPRERPFNTQGEDCWLPTICVLPWILCLNKKANNWKILSPKLRPPVVGFRTSAGRSFPAKRPPAQRTWRRRLRRMLRSVPGGCPAENVRRSHHSASLDSKLPKGGRKFEYVSHQDPSMAGKKNCGMTSQWLFLFGLFASHSQIS